MRIRTNVLYSSILTCSNYLFQLITYPYVSRVLGVERIGVCNFAVSFVHYILLFSTMGISILGIREVARCREDRQELNRCFSSLFYLHAVATGIVLLLYVGAVYFVPALYPYRDLLHIGTLQILFNLFLVEWFFKGIEDFKYITYRNIAVRFLYVLAVFLLVRSPEDYPVYFGLIVGAIVLNGLVNWRYRMKFVRLVWQGVSLKKYLPPFFVLGVYLLLTSMYTSFNVLYLGFVGGDTEVGYYTTASKMYTVLLGLFTAFTGVMMPRMSNLVAQGDYGAVRRLSRQSFNLLFACAVPLVFFCEVFAPQFIGLLSGSGYEGAIVPMRIIMPLVLVIGMEQILIVQLLTPLKQDRAVFVNSVFGAAVALLTNVLLVHHYLSVGSSWVWVLSELSVLCSALYFINRQPQLEGIIPWAGLMKNILWMLPLLVIYLLAQGLGCNSLLWLAGCALLTMGYVLLVQVRVMRNELFVGMWKKNWGKNL